MFGVTGCAQMVIWRAGCLGGHECWHLRVLQYPLLKQCNSEMAAMSGHGSGELGRVQQQASSSRRGLPAGSLLASSGGLRAGLGQGRGHLEANMAAALALQSPQEYKRWLATYSSHLAGDFQYATLP